MTRPHTRRVGHTLLGLTLGLTTASLLGGCLFTVPWKIAFGEWREGVPHEPLIFSHVSDQTARKAASAALVGLRERPFNLKDVKVVAVPASDSVMLMASLPFKPPNPPKLAPGEPSLYADAVLPVFVRVRWQAASLTHFDVTSRIIRTPFHTDWIEAYDATGSADAAPAYLMRRASDMRTVAEANRMNDELDRLAESLTEGVRADLPWVIEEVTR